MRKRWLKILLFILLVPFLLLCAFLLFERIRGQIALAHYKRELIAEGEKLMFKELIPPTPEGENGTPEALQAIERLQKGSVLPNNAPPVMRVTPSGHAVVGFWEDEWVSDIGFRDGEWVSGKVTNSWAQLARELRTNDSTLAEIRSALAKPVLINELDYTLGYKMKFLHFAPLKSTTYWFGAASQLALRDGRNQVALDNLIAEVRLARMLSEDRLLISELVRIAIAAIARTATWEALQADGWTDRQLAQLQDVWQSTEFVTNAVLSLEGERAFGETAYVLARRSNEEAVKMLFVLDEIGFLISGEETPSPWWRRILTKQIYSRLWRFAWSYQDERYYLNRMQQLIDIARRAESEKSYTDILPAIEELDEQRLGGFYDQLRFRSSSQSIMPLSRVLDRAMRAETERSITVCAIALQRYSLRHGKYPASLDALVPEFLSSVPIDCMDGKPLRYRLNDDDSFLLYSVGEDGRDDGGDTSLLPDKHSYRNLWDRKDFVWPAPATAEETEAWRKEQIKD